MSGDQLDLDALDAAYALGGRPTLSEGIALVAEVRRLRAAISQQGRSACGERAPYGGDVCERPPMHPGEHCRAGHWWSLR